MKRSGRSPLFQQLKRTFHAAQLRNKGLSLPPVSRRNFITGSAAALLAAYTSKARSAPPPVQGPRVAVVGAGIAGLNCSYLLAQAGFNVTLYEGSDHAGGRIQTDIGTVAANITTELGGEFIDSDHQDMLSLAALFNLDLIDTFAPSESDLQIAYYADGRLRPEDEVIQAFLPLAAIVENDFNNTSDDITFDSHSGFDVKLDHTDLAKYFRKNIDTPWLADILEAAYVNEFGLDLQDQSSINFVWTIGTDTSDGFQIYGVSDQRFKILGGNQQIVDGLASAVQNKIQLEHILTAISQQSSGSYTLNFDRPHSGKRTVTADIVVLCIPFTILRNVDIRVPLPEVKTKAIQNLGYGTNAKLILGFQSRAWRDAGFTGDSYADQPYQSGWDASRLQPASNQGAYTLYAGGTDGTDYQPGTKIDQAHRLLPGLQAVFPSLKNKWLGTALRAYWPANPFVKASYACYTPGQYTSIRGAEGFPVGNLYFAGEHTSLDFQGYMNGGAQSGREVAEALIGP